VEYKKGRENIAAYGLSRRDETDANIRLMITAVESDWIEHVKTVVQTDGYFQDLNNK